MSQYTFTPIGTLHSPFREKFGIPRQPGLAPHAISRLVLHSDCARAECVDGLAGYSHLWLLFAFHATAAQGWQATVRPPRLGGNTRTGVFATRSMFRPNPIGLSAVELVGIIDGPHGKELLLRGADLLDGTPVLDIKPYLPYADAIPEARAELAPAAPPQLAVHWSDNALANAASLQVDENLRVLINEVLAQDPRPAYQAAQGEAREYAVWLANVDVRFTAGENALCVLALQQRNS